MINRYKSNIDSFIIKQKIIHNTSKNITTILGAWDDIAWGVSPNRFRFCKFGSNKHLSERNIPIQSHLSDNYIYFCKAYLSYIFIEHGSQYPRLVKEISALRCIVKLLEYKNLEIYQINRDLINEVFTLINDFYMKGSQETLGASVCYLIKFMTSKEMLNTSLNITNPFKFNSNCTEALIKNKEKLPSKNVIFAIADIYYRTMPKDINKCLIFENVLARMACSIASILFAAPSRISELALLSRNKEPNNKSFKFLNEIKDISGTSYSLVWRGSKKMLDNEKHIISSMAPIVNDSLNYLNKIGEPARILCKFYEDPRIILKNLLPRNYQNKSLNLNTPTRLFQLGGILGFYSTSDLKKINSSITQGHYKSNSSENLLTTRFKDLFPEFPLNYDVNTPVSTIVRNRLLGLHKQHKIKWPKTYMTIGEIEIFWCAYLVSKIETFPYRIRGTDNKKILLSNALIISCGKQKGKRKNSTKGLSSLYGINTGVDTIFRTAFKMDSSNNLFKKYGYDLSIFSLNTHQIRHYLGTQVSKTDLTQENIAKLFGRKSTGQNKVYDHRTDDEKHAEIVSVFPKKKLNINPITIKEFKDLTDKEYASKTSTGVCIQSLHVSPCTYLQVGKSGCTGCFSHCYIKGDEKSLSYLKDDLKFQMRRIHGDEMVNRNINQIMKKQFDVLINNIRFLHSLIEILENDKIENGAIIRFSHKTTFKVLSTDKSDYEISVNLQLPSEIKKMLDDNKISVPTDEKNENTDFNKLFKSLNTMKSEKKPLELKVLK